MAKFIRKSLILASIISISMGMLAGVDIEAYGERQIDQFLNDMTKDYVGLNGQDRYDTSRLISQMAYDHSDEVIIVDGSNYVDSMSALQLSAYLDAPILLNSRRGLDRNTNAEIARLKAEHVYIVGCNINPKLESDLVSEGYKVQTISADKPFDLSYKCGEFADKNKNTNKKSLILASSEVFADSLSMSSYSYTNKIPMLLVGKDIDDSTAKIINDYGAEEVLVVGGENTISNESMAKISRARRISGQDRYQTSRIIHKEYYPDSENILISSGTTFADTVAATPLATAMKTNILLVKESSEEVHDYHFKKIVAVGGLVKKYVTDVVYINPHQDDESIDMGLDIIRDVKDGRKVYLILMTDGSKSRVYEALDREFIRTSRSRISRKDFIYLRDMEMVRALEIMGVKKENVIFTHNRNLEIDKDIVIKAIEKFEEEHGKNFSYKSLAKNVHDKSGGNVDHFACHDGVKEFCQKNSRNCTFYSSVPTFDDSAIFVKNPTYEEREIWTKALRQYDVTDPSLGCYGVGFRSVGGIMNRKMNNMREFIDYN